MTRSTQPHGQDVVMKVYIGPSGFAPTRANSTDAGLDLYATTDVFLDPGQQVSIDTDVCLEIPEGFYGKVCGRSSITGAGLLVPDGTIDSGYRGAIKVLMANLSHTPYMFWLGDRIAQLLILPCWIGNIEVVDTLEDLELSTRGSDGFGSTGR